MDRAVQAYLDAIPPEHRPSFDRIHGLVLEEHPTASLALSYQLPTYAVGQYRLYMGVWKHGLSFYGWQPGRDAGFSERHPELLSGKATMRLQAADFARLPDQELRDFLRAALGG